MSHAVLKRRPSSPSLLIRKKSLIAVLLAPKQLTVYSVTPTSAILTWIPPHGMDQTSLSYQISYHSGGSESETISTDSCSADITGLKPCTDYSVSVCTKLKDGGMSEPAKKEVCTAVLGPVQLTGLSVTPTSINLTWTPPHGMEETPHFCQISYHSGGTEPQIISRDSCRADITGLKPYTNYSVSVCTKVTDDEMSKAVRTDVRTAVAAPEQLTVVSVTPTSVHLTWNPPHGMDQTPESYQVSYHDGRSKPFFTHSCSAIIESLEPCNDYVVSVCTKLKDGAMSEPAKQVVHTEILTMKFYTIVIGNTQKHHQALKGMLISKGLKEVKNVESCDLILAFCVIVSRVETDMEAALKEIPDSKPAVLAVMHHTCGSDHVTPDTSRFVRGRNIMVVDILFHEDKGILRCPRNTEADNKMLEMVWACSEPGRPKYLLPTRQARLPPPIPRLMLQRTHQVIYHLPNMEAAQANPLDTNRGHKKALKRLLAVLLQKSNTLLSGNTLGAHKDVQKHLADKGVLPKEKSSVGQCDFLLVFCSVVSSVESDIEKALKHIPDDKPSILVVMHHTFSTDYQPPGAMLRAAICLL
ncbi:uncharacterized protein LOC143127433 [Alosa pseudoharengus]|uniref:uncharacterized protein LOC143127433 n=1 Tax=Alosa pseudoharengus TaxID=34774 RepID=UPI003F8C13B0